jgi:hypothetical protein
MIHLVDKTVETLLKRELSSAFATPVELSFLAPDNEFPPPGVHPPAINLFLYDIRENRDLRSNEWTLERRNHAKTEKRFAPVRADLSYLITAWPAKTSIEDEHKILGAVMIALLRNPTIPGAVLAEGLDDIELPTSTLQPGRLQSLAEFWQALGGKPKTALNYVVTVAVPGRPPQIEPLVIDKMIEIKGAVERLP